MTTAAAQTHRRLADTLTGIIGDVPPMEARRRLLDVIDLYRNEDSLARDYAIDAIASGRAAYWSATGYSDQRGCNLLLGINKGFPIADALVKNFPAFCADWREGALDYLIPINRAAATALSLAYAEFGTWRDEDELELRRVRDLRRSAV